MYGVLFELYRVTYLNYTGCPIRVIQGVLFELYWVSYSSYTGFPVSSIYASFRSETGHIVQYVLRLFI